MENDFKRQRSHFCQLCNVYVKDEESWKRHLEGKKHKKKASAKPAGQPEKPNVKSADPCMKCESTSQDAQSDAPKLLIDNNHQTLSAQRAESTPNPNGLLASGPDIQPIPSTTSENSCDQRASFHHCHTCDVNCNSEANMISHYGSQKHKAATEIAIRGANLYAEYLQRALLSSECRPPFVSERSSQEIITPELEISAAAVRNALQEVEDSRRWEQFLDAVRQGINGMLRFESYQQRSEVNCADFGDGGYGGYDDFDDFDDCDDFDDFDDY